MVWGLEDIDVTMNTFERRNAQACVRQAKLKPAHAPSKLQQVTAAAASAITRNWVIRGNSVSLFKIMT
jgi:hypothetical protein